MVAQSYYNSLIHITYTKVHCKHVQPKNPNHYNLPTDGHGHAVFSLSVYQEALSSRLGKSRRRLTCTTLAVMTCPCFCSHPSNDSHFLSWLTGFGHATRRFFFKKNLAFINVMLIAIVLTIYWNLSTNEAGPISYMGLPKKKFIGPSPPS